MGDGWQFTRYFFRHPHQEKRKFRFFRSPACAPTGCSIQNGPYTATGDGLVCVACIVACTGCERSANQWRETRMIRGTCTYSKNYFLIAVEEADDSAIFRNLSLCEKHPLSLAPQSGCEVSRAALWKRFLYAGMLSWAAVSHSCCRNPVSPSWRTNIQRLALARVGNATRVSRTPSSTQTGCGERPRTVGCRNVWGFALTFLILSPFISQRKVMPDVVVTVVRNTMVKINMK